MKNLKILTLNEVRGGGTLCKDLAIHLTRLSEFNVIHCSNTTFHCINHFVENCNEDTIQRIGYINLHHEVINWKTLDKFVLIVENSMKFSGLRVFVTQRLLNQIPEVIHRNLNYRNVQYRLPDDSLKRILNFGEN